MVRLPPLSHNVTAMGYGPATIPISKEARRCHDASGPDCHRTKSQVPTAPPELSTPNLMCPVRSPLSRA